MNPSLLLILLVAGLAALCRSYNMEDFMKNYPAANSPNNRVLGMILAFDLVHIDPLIVIFNEYLSMCEAGWNPTIVVFTVVNWSPQLRRLFRQKMYCYRTDSVVPVLTSIHNASLGIGLGAMHRTYMAERLSEFDFFIYHEDDIVVKLNHLHGYLKETQVLQSLLPQNELNTYLIGFQRYRRIFKADGHAPFNEQDVFEQELLEEMPDFHPACIANRPYLLVKGNTHQAMWMLTYQQVMMLQDRCGFLNQSSASREYMSSFSLFDSKKYHCGMSKLLPGTRLMTFSVLHHYQQRHISWTPTFFADENIRAGYQYQSTNKAEISPPECWRTLVLRTRAEQSAIEPPTEVLTDTVQ